MEPIRVFLDANALFGAALGGAAYALLLELAAEGRVALLTSRYCSLEAERNHAWRFPEQRKPLPALMRQVKLVPDPPVSIPVPHLPRRDAPVWRSAVAARAHVLLTGDRKHFGHLMARSDLPVRVRTVKGFLLAGPDVPPAGGEGA